MTFFTKSILSLVLLGSTLIAFFTMFELMGRKEKRFNPKLLRTVHRVNGYCFLILFLILSYYCLKIMRAAGVEPSPRVALHGLLAVATFLFLSLKLSITLFYRQYLPKVAPLGNWRGVAGPRHYGQFCGLLFYHERGDHSCCFRYGRGKNCRGSPGTE